jgi:hypothetical protein
MPRVVRFALAILLLALAAAPAFSGQAILAQERVAAQLDLTLRLTPAPGASAFVGGWIDVQFSGAGNGENAGAGVVELSVLDEAVSPEPVSMLGTLSWSTGDLELPVPPNDVTVSLFAANGDPYRVMLTTTADTQFTTLSESPGTLAMIVHGTIHLHISTGTLLAVDETVQVRGNAIYSETGALR